MFHLSTSCMSLPFWVTTLGSVPEPNWPTQNVPGQCGWRLFPMHYPVTAMGCTGTRGTRGYKNVGSEGERKMFTKRLLLSLQPELEMCIYIYMYMHICIRICICVESSLGALYPTAQRPGQAWEVLPTLHQVVIRARAGRRQCRGPGSQRGGRRKTKKNKKKKKKKKSKPTCELPSILWILGPFGGSTWDSARMCLRIHMYVDKHIYICVATT